MAISLPSNVRGPILDLALPATILQVDITIRNATTGKTLTIVLPEDWNGDDLTLDWFRRTVRDQTGADRSALLDPSDNSLWTDPSPFLPGANDIEVEANGGAVIATDSYEQTAGNLTGRTTGTGAKTYEAAGGSDADDFTIDTVNDKAQRTAVSDGSADTGRGVLLGAGVYKGTRLRATFGYSTLRSGHRQSLLARAADLSNCLRLDFVTEAFAGETAGIACRLLKRKAGVSTTIANPAVLPGSTTLFPGSVTLGLEVKADGTWKVTGPLGSIEGAADADLKSGAVLDDGRVGVYDAWTSATAATRTVDDLRAIDLDSAGVYGAEATLRWEKGYY